MEKKKTKRATPAPKPKEKRLVRSSKDQVIAGVCSGIANYFDIDPVIVRILFALVALTAGSGILVYIVLWIVMPEESDEGKKSDDVIEKNTKQVQDRFEDVVSKVDTQKGRKIFQALFGFALMFFGLYLLLDNFGLRHYFSFFWYLSKLWPVFIILIGLYILFKKDE